MSHSPHNTVSTQQQPRQALPVLRFWYTQCPDDAGASHVQVQVLEYYLAAILPSPNNCCIILGQLTCTRTQPKTQACPLEQTKRVRSLDAAGTLRPPLLWPARQTCIPGLVLTHTTNTTSSLQAQTQHGWSLQLHAARHPLWPAAQVVA